MAYKTVGDVIAAVRVLLQDTDSASYRYDDASLYQGMNAGLLETRRVRPELYRARGFVAPQYSVADAGNSIDFEPMYIPTLIYFITGWAQLRDSEEATDARATQFVQAFGKQMVSTV